MSGMSEAVPHPVAKLPHKLAKASFATPDGTLHLWCEFDGGWYLPLCLIDDYLRVSTVGDRPTEWLQEADDAVFAPATCIICLGAS